MASGFRQPSVWVAMSLLLLLLVQGEGLLRLQRSMDTLPRPVSGLPGGKAPEPALTPLPTSAPGGSAPPAAGPGPSATGGSAPPAAGPGPSATGGSAPPAAGPGPSATGGSAPPAAGPGPSATGGSAPKVEKQRPAESWATPPDFLGPHYLPNIVTGVLALGASRTPLSAEQRQRMQEPARTIREAAFRTRGDLVRAVRALDDAQFAELYKQHPPPAPATGQVAVWGDPTLARALSTLEKKAGSAPGPLRSPLPGEQLLPPNSERFMVLTGIIYLESTADYALTAAQARTVVDALTDLKADEDRLTLAIRELWVILTAEQQLVVRDAGLSTSIDTISAECLDLWARKP